jgi:hypothetical protein
MDRNRDPDRDTDTGTERDSNRDRNWIRDIKGQGHGSSVECWHWSGTLIMIEIWQN